MLSGEPRLRRRRPFGRGLKKADGIFMRSELHAQEFTRHISDHVADRTLGLHDRRRIFEQVLNHIASLPIAILNVCLDVPKCGGVKTAHQWAVERLSNRVQKMMRGLGSYAVVVFDEGKEGEIRKLVRKMNVFNPVPSAFGMWPEGDYRNIVLDRFIDDPFFRPSHATYFLQWADFVAFTLLKQEVAMTPFVAKWGYNKLFPILHPKCWLRASPRDPAGIVR
jgi:uncharacterized protein DUF3800